MSYSADDLINIGRGYVAWCTNPWPEPKLTHRHWYHQALRWGQLFPVSYKLMQSFNISHICRTCRHWNICSSSKHYTHTCIHRIVLSHKIHRIFRLEIKEKIWSAIEMWIFYKIYCQISDNVCHVQQYYAVCSNKASTRYYLPSLCRIGITEIHQFSLGYQVHPKYDWLIIFCIKGARVKRYITRYRVHASFPAMDVTNGAPLQQIISYAFLKFVCVYMSGSYDIFFIW